ncbi:DUF4007 family protein [Pedobacter psychrotolerans]|uniref:DUF4007 family protein n=1 Tax=Pedobacter psychrotolerans TaxID=1843235 RepID=UPI003F9AB9D0
MSQAIANSTNIRFTFSGHESFHCRQMWLKKGYDFVRKGKSFNDPEAVVELGVGKNMVTSIKFWLKSFNIIDSNDEITHLGHFIFESDGFDPYLEDDQSLWLLHYSLIKNKFSSIYSLIFNEFRKEKIRFSKENFQAYATRRLENSNLKTIGDDFDVFKKTYLNKSEDIKLTEDSFLGLLSDLQLVKLFEKGTYYIDNIDRPSLSSKVFLYSILDNENYGYSISLHALENDENSPGVVFALSRQSLLDNVEKLTEEFSWITFSDQAGVKELQFKNKPQDLFSIFN